MTFSCKQAAQLISTSMDRRLSLGERFSLRFHLLVCGMCRTYRRQLAILRRLLRDQVKPDENLPNAYITHLSAEARQRIGRALGMPGGLSGGGNSP